MEGYVYDRGTFYECLLPQKSAMWHKWRLGRFTGSEIHKLLKPKGFGDTGLSYIKQKAAELISQMPEESFSSQYTQNGIQLEPVARELYGKLTGQIITETGIFISKENTNIASSPDGILENNYYIEIKCPATMLSHLNNLLMESQDELSQSKPEYYAQIQLLLMVTGAKKCSYISYYPFFPENLMLNEMVVISDYNFHNFMKGRIEQAVEIRNNITKKLTGKIIEPYLEL